MQGGHGFTRCQDLRSWNHIGPKLRRSAYNKVGYDHLVVLAEGLKPNEALLIERGLFKAMTEDRRRATYRKYHPKKRDGPYRASLGGKQTSDSPDWVVYLAWKCCSAIT